MRSPRIFLRGGRYVDIRAFSLEELSDLSVVTDLVPRQQERTRPTRRVLLAICKSPNVTHPSRRRPSVHGLINRKPLGWPWRRRRYHAERKKAAKQQLPGPRRKKIRMRGTWGSPLSTLLRLGVNTDYRGRRKGAG